MRDRIELCSGVMLRSASNTRSKPLGKLCIYLRLNVFIVSFYFGVVESVPSMILVGTTSRGRSIENITPETRKLTTLDSHPLQTVALKYNTVSAISIPQPFTTHHTIK